MRRAWPYRELAREEFDADRRHAGRGLHHPPRPARRADPSRRGQRRAARPARRAADRDHLRRHDPRQRRLPGAARAREPRHRHASTRTSRSRAWPATSSSSATAATRSSASSAARCASRMRKGSRRPSRSGWARRPAAATSCRPRCRACAPTSQRAPAPRSDAAIELLRWLTDELAHRAGRAAEQLVDYLRAGYGALGCLPTQDTIVLERFFDEAGGMQLVVHSPYGSRSTAPGAWRCASASARKFNFELQAAATEDNIVISLTEAHSFELADVARYLQLEHGARRADPGGARFADVHHALALGGRRVARPAALPRRPQGAAAARAHAGRGPGRRGVPRPDRLRREPAGRARDPRPSAGQPGARTTACTRRWTSTASSGCCRASKRATIEVVARELTAAVAARARGAVGAALRLPRRRAAGGAPHPGGDGAPLARRRRQPPTRPARSRGDRARAGRGVARRRPTPTNCTMRWSGSAS